MKSLVEIVVDTEDYSVTWAGESGSRSLVSLE